MLLATLDVERRPGVFAYVVVPTGSPPPPAAVAMVDEGDTTSYVVDAATLPSEGDTFRAAWLTLTVHSSLEAVGLTAAFSSALAQHGIPANVLAGFHHDHVLVPEDRADEAITVLRALATRAR